MKYTVTLPVLAGDNNAVCVVVAWEKHIGDVVQQGDPLLRVQMGPLPTADTPTVLVPSPAFGVLARRIVSPGEAVEAGEPIAVLSGVPTEAAPTPPPVSTRPSYVPQGSEQSLLLSPAERMLAEHYALSARVSPHVFTVAQADVSEAHRLIGRVARGETVSGAPERLSLLPFVVHAAAAALRRFPALNAQLMEGGTEVRRKDYIHIGVILRESSGGRPVVPVLRDADRRSVLALAREIEEFATRTRTNALRSEDVRPGATFTLEEIAGEGQGDILYQTSLLHRPQAAFLSVGNVTRQPVVETGADGTERIVVRSQVHLCLAHDARIVDGAEAAAFLAEISRNLGEARFLFT